MKKKSLVIVTVLLVIFTLAISWSVFHHRYHLSLMSRFTIPDFKTVSKHEMLDGYAVSFALSDSLMYITDTSDTTQTRSYCYDYTGKISPGFNFPAHKGYWQNFADKSLFYLPDSKMLAYNHWQSHKVDYYKLDGTFIKQDTTFWGLQENVLSLAEFKSSQYFVTIFIDNNKPAGSKQILRFSRVKSGSNPMILKNITLTKDFLKHGWTFKNLMVDDNGKDNMILLENQFKKPLMTLFQKDKATEFDLKTPVVFGILSQNKLPFQLVLGLNKIPYQMVLGQNYIVIGSWLPSLQYPLTQRIYNLRGSYLGKLQFKDDPQNELMDIIDDKLVAFNPYKGVVSVYKITVRAK